MSLFLAVKAVHQERFSDKGQLKSSEVFGYRPFVTDSANSFKKLGKLIATTSYLLPRAHSVIPLLLAELMREDSKYLVQLVN